MLCSIFVPVKKVALSTHQPHLCRQQLNNATVIWGNGVTTSGNELACADFTYHILKSFFRVDNGYIPLSVFGKFLTSPPNDQQRYSPDMGLVPCNQTRTSVPHSSHGSLHASFSVFFSHSSTNKLLCCFPTIPVAMWPPGSRCGPNSVIARQPWTK